MLPISSAARRSSVASVRTRCLTAALVCLLAACGGGSETGTADAGAGNPALSRAAEEAPAETTRSAPSASDQTLIAQGAQLSNTELLAAEQQAEAAGAAVPKSAYASGQVVAKALATRIPAYRFYNGSTGAHFFTTSTTERNHVQANLSPPFSYEGPAFSVASASSPGLSPVHRFFNTRSGVHFYTISESERAHVVANLPQFSYEGVAYHASQVAGQGLVPLYRFYLPSRGFHFYTASLGERDNIIANLSGTYSYEGVGYHVLDTTWRPPAVPHTGVGSSSCYQAGATALVACNGGGAAALNPQQDGHRAAVNPMSYSEVPRPAGGNYARTECVRDNVTGLIWEGKDAAAGALTYSNLANSQSLDASSHVAAINAAGRCGFTDWRLPTRQELMGISRQDMTTSPAVDAAWFPNANGAPSWSVDVYMPNPELAWSVHSEGSSFITSRESYGNVRLVRGGLPMGARFSYSSVSYPGDAGNNVVVDAWTGLQWRRCEQGRSWTGSACSGTSATPLNHTMALEHARQQSGWRLPNIKELASLTNLSITSTPFIDPVAFPGAQPHFIWASTPNLSSPTDAWRINFVTGQIGVHPRTETLALRLVRITP